MENKLTPKLTPKLRPKLQLIKVVSNGSNSTLTLSPHIVTSDHPPRLKMKLLLGSAGSILCQHVGSRLIPRSST